MVRNDQRRVYYWALLNEIRMLIDYVAANATHSIGEIHLKDPRSPSEEMMMGAILSRLDEINSELEHPSQAAAGHTIKPEDAAFLQLMRDMLNEMARPASSLTVAYTALVTGSLRSKDAESRARLASQAYGGMISTAYWHRRTQQVFLGVAVIITLLAVRESSKVALGRDYMRNLANLQSQQVSTAAEKTRLEGMLRRALELCPDGKVLSEYLKQPDIDPPLRAQVHDVCGRDYVLAKNFGIVHDQLKVYKTNWREMGGTLSSDKNAGDDVEFVIGPQLTMWGNYLLPVIFGFLGVLVFVIVDFYDKIRDSRLDPRDYRLSLIRLVLGLVTGSCIGLFYSATPPTDARAAQSAASALSLSASGIAFLAGYGVEGVFKMLEDLVSRVFVTQQSQR